MLRDIRLRNMMSMLPQWMEMAQNEESNGARFLSIFGFEMDEIEKEIDNILNDSTLNTYDVNNADIAYKIPLALSIVVDIIGKDSLSVILNGNEYFLREAITIEKFYSKEEEDTSGAIGKYIVDKEDGVIYARFNSDIEIENIERPVESFNINGIQHYDYVVHHIWNGLDEIGLLFGVERNFAEKNKDYKERIIESIKKPSNASEFGIVNQLSKELNIPTSLIKINEMSDTEFKESLLSEDGEPLDEFIDIVESINDKFERTWGSANWDSTLWTSTRASTKGFNQLPHYWGGSLTELVGKENIQSGIGGGDDLLVLPPKVNEEKQVATITVSASGIVQTEEVENTQVDFSYKITASGKVLNEDYLPELFKYRIEASELLMLVLAIRAYSIYESSTKIDFKNNKSGYSLHGVDIVDGLDNLSRKDADYIHYEVISDLATDSPDSTPRIEGFRIKWLDNDNKEHIFEFKDQEDFTQNSNAVKTRFIDTFSPRNGGVELGFGTFYHEIDTHGAFLRGQITSNAKINRKGSISLRLPNE